MLDWRVDTFLDVCETLNYTHTAARLNITQPAVSQHIAWLEKQYETPLFSRKGRTLVLTDAGKEVAEVLLSQRNDENLLKQELSTLNSGVSKLVIGATLTAGEFMLARPLARWCSDHPLVQVRVVMADTADLLSDLDKGAIDCALVEGIFDSTKYSFREWSYEQMKCVCACGSKVAIGASKVDSGILAANNTPLRFRDLLENTLIIREQGSGSRAVLEACLARNNLVPESFKRVIEVKGVGLGLEMVRAGTGITFAYESAVSHRLAQGELHVISAQGICHTQGELQEIKLCEEGLGHSICFVWRRNSFFEKRFIQLFEELQHFLPK